MKKTLEYLGIALLSTFLVVKGILPGWNRVHSDFANYYVSSRLLIEKADLTKLYDDRWFQQQIYAHGIEQHGKFAPFPPATAWIMLPLTPFDPLTAQRIWTTFNLLLLGAHIFLFTKITSWSWHASALFILFSGWGLCNNFAFGQVYLLMSVSLVLGYVLVRNNRSILAGILYGFFTVVKYFPLVFLFGYCLTKYYRPLAAALITIGTLLFLQWVFFGEPVVSGFISHVFLPHLDGNLGNQGQFIFQYQSWDSFLRFLFTVDPMQNPDPLFPWAHGRMIVKTILYLSALSATTWALWNSKGLSHEKRVALSLSLPAIAALVLLPASATYHFVLLIFPLGLLFNTGLLEKRERTVIFMMYALIGFIPYDFAYVLAEKWGLFFAYPRLWLISLLYLTVLVSLSKKLKSLYLGKND